MKHKTFTILGMHCASCAVRNEEAIKKIPGVKEVSVNFGTHNASVHFDENQVSEDVLYEAVVKNGYKVMAEESKHEHHDMAKMEVSESSSTTFSETSMASS